MLIEQTEKEQLIKAFDKQVKPEEFLTEHDCNYELFSITNSRILIVNLAGPWCVSSN